MTYAETTERQQRAVEAATSMLTHGAFDSAIALLALRGRTATIVAKVAILAAGRGLDLVSGDTAARDPEVILALVEPVQDACVRLGLSRFSREQIAEAFRTTFREVA